MVDGLDIEGAHDLRHAALVVHRAEQRHDLAGRRQLPGLLLQAALDAVERRLGELEQHELRRPEPDDLAAELGADRAAGARDQDVLALDAGVQQLRDRRHRVPAEQFPDLHVTDLVDARLAGHDVAYVRHGHYTHGKFRQPLEHLAACPSRSAGHREQDALHGRRAYQPPEFVGRIDFQLVDALAEELGIVVDERDRQVIVAVHEGGNQLRAGPPRAVDDDGFAVRVPADEKHTCRDAAADDKDQRKGPEHDAHADRGARQAGKGRHGHECHGHEKRRLCAHVQQRQPGVAHDRRIQAEEPVHGHADGNREQRYRHDLGTEAGHAEHDPEGNDGAGPVRAGVVANHGCLFCLSRQGQQPDAQRLQ